MTQAFAAPVSGAAQAAATRLAHTSAGGSGPPGADNETPAFSSVLDHQVARTAHAEGQNKTTGDSGGRRSSHAHRAGKSHQPQDSSSSGATTDSRAASGSGAAGRRHHHAPVDRAQATAGQTSGHAVRADDVQSSGSATQQTQPVSAQATTVAQSTLAATATAPAQPAASTAGDATQATAGANTQANNFIRATIQAASASTLGATPGDEQAQSDQVDAATPQNTGDSASLTASAATADDVTGPTPPAPQSTAAQAAQVGTPAAQVGTPAAQVAAPTNGQPADAQSTGNAGAQSVQLDAQQTPQPPATATATPPASVPAAAAQGASAGQDPVTAQSTVPGAIDAPGSEATAGANANNVPGQAATHTAKTGDPSTTAHDVQQPGASATSSVAAQAQAFDTATQDPGHNGTAGQPSAQTPAQAPAPAPQSAPEQPVAVQAADTTMATAGITAAPGSHVTAAASTAAATTAPGAARYGIGLSEAVETVKTTIELGSRQGFTQARIQLAPATLGQITIHLQKTADGIVAKVIADHSAAAQTMQQGGDDLRRSLQNSGLHLLRLDIETRGDQRGSAGHSGQTSGSGQPAGDQDSASDTPDTASQPTTLVLPNGALVNVLA